MAELGRGPIGRSLVSGEVEVGERDPSQDPDRPYVSIPLRVSDKPVGAIAIFDLLQQKDGLTPLDHELFTLLAGHAATAIMAARLYAQSERKLHTIQGFLDLLTK